MVPRKIFVWMERENFLGELSAGNFPVGIFSEGEGIVWGEFVEVFYSRGIYTENIPPEKAFTG